MVDAAVVLLFLVVVVVWWLLYVVLLCDFLAAMEGWSEGKEKRGYKPRERPNSTVRERLRQGEKTVRERERMDPEGESEETLRESLTIYNNNNNNKLKLK